MGSVDHKFACSSCGKAWKIMKRCTRCRDVIYCSKECQVIDWMVHRKKCSSRDRASATGAEVNENGSSTIARIGCTETTESSELLKNKNDKVIPPIRTTIIVKCNHKKHKIDLIDVETHPGSEIMKQLAKQLHIPLSSLKVVGKGKLLHPENIRDILIQCKCRIFQAFGEESEDEGGLDVDDIEAIMERLHVGRNDAIRSLRSCNGDLIDAILELGNKM